VVWVARAFDWVGAMPPPKASKKKAKGG